MFECCGLERELFYAYNRQNVNKMKILALTDYEFDGNIDNDEDGLKID